MISPLIRWDHSKDFYILQGTELYPREEVVTIAITDEEFAYLTGHVINGKNLFPSTGYLFLLWERIGTLRNQEYSDVPVVFEDITFHRATTLSKYNNVELNISIQKGIIVT
ncbi:PREDICTED: fatty acid synthase-like [Vollenhovia emeryi]|uniref:fatty acid synthase-like n=1 Tax=Vollenhovia emeryi TaxID=411798 RepID=UPI0005F3B4AD|nr:PREDICTED: fatty acid synthase-like [Vollenhovia emeryi]